MTTLAKRAETWLAYRLARIPDAVVRRTTARAPVVVDRQTLELRTQHAIAVLARGASVPLHQMTVVAARREYIRFPQIFEDPPVALARVEDGLVPSASGHVPVRVYRPRVSDARLPVLVYYHGGGGVIGSIETHDGLCRLLAKAIDCVVVSVEYRLGPEHPFPAAPEDAFLAYRWAVRHADDFGGDSKRVAVGGDSMGGNLAAVVSQLARDAGRGTPCGQLLLYPSTDRAAKTDSFTLFAEGFLLTAPLMGWFAELYLGGADPHDPRISPLRHPDLSGLPPAVVVTAGFDPLRDEGRAYAERLEAAGVPTRYRCHEGLIHGFVQMTGAVPAARRAVLAAAGELRAIFDAA
ncbi:MAG: alpha/beta hydrolase [Deltaproteobacteria bacterium]|nr:alpha/beta hydrolase [Deltaproteobacteria bacterium]